MAPSTAVRPPSTLALVALLAAGIAGCAPGASRDPGSVASNAPAPPADGARGTGAERDAAAAPALADWVWTFHPDPPRALYGPPASEAFLVVECVDDGSASGSVRHTVYAPADSGATATLAVSGNGRDVRLTMDAVPTELGPAWIWEGSTPWAEVAAPYTDGPDPVTYALGDSTAWSVPDPGPVRQVLASCGAESGG